MKLTASSVEELFKEALCNEGEGSVIQGVVMSARMQIEGMEARIADLLNQLPAQFQQKLGGGWSFMCACNDSDGVMWTGDHQMIDKLVMLGLASKQVEFLLERQSWPVLPGGMPYFQILDGVTSRSHPEATEVK